MKIWFKLWTDTRLSASETIEITDEDTRTHKIFRALEEACLAFDLGKPFVLALLVAYVQYTIYRRCRGHK